MYFNMKNLPFEFVYEDTSRIFFTSDLHFCHNRDFIYKPRGFNSVDEMNQAIIENWNKTVKNEDIVFVLGDLMLNDNDTGARLINQLQGYKIVILGNHDTDARREIYRGLRDVVDVDYANIFQYHHYTFYLSHYPTLIGNFEENKKFYCLAGHTHSKDKFENWDKGVYNIALDAHNNTPVSIDDIIQDIKEKRYESKFNT